MTILFYDSFEPDFRNWQYFISNSTITGSTTYAYDGIYSAYVTVSTTTPEYAIARKTFSGQTHIFGLCYAYIPILPSTFQYP